jgi:hypothetical protein
MKSMISIIGFLLLASFTTPASRSEIKYQGHKEWLDDRYREAISIKAGMTRADLLTVFVTTPSAKADGFVRHPRRNRPRFA